MSMRDPNYVSAIGAIAPSSRWLAQAMTRYVGERPNAHHILEVGAGTGAITKVLLKRMQEPWHLDVVEIFPKFALVLRRRFRSQQMITVHCQDVLCFKPDYQYDAIVCSLPFNAFLPEMTAAIFDRLFTLSKDQATISFFEYKIIQKAAPLIFSKERLAHFYQSRAIIDRYIADYKFDEHAVALNIPPAVVHHLRVNKSKY